MCMLIFKPAGIELSEADLSNAWADNQDGAGFAFVERGRLKIEKGYWLESEFLADVSRLSAYPAIVHMRYATHGSRDDANCHPFDLQADGAFAHNGIIPGMGTGFGSYRTYAWETVGTGKIYKPAKNPQPAKSDTAEFVEKFLLGKSYSWCKSSRKFITSKLAGSKGVSLHSNGKALIYNATAGHWRRGAWFSNHGYLPRANVSVTNTGGYVGGWRWDSEDEKELTNEVCSLPARSIPQGIHSYTDAEWAFIENERNWNSEVDPLERIETLHAIGNWNSTVKSQWLEWALDYYGDSPETRAFLQRYASDLEDSSNGTG